LQQLEDKDGSPGQTYAVEVVARALAVKVTLAVVARALAVVARALAVKVALAVL